MALSAGQEDDVMSTINITPFTDVLLVLLIIFIILASVTKEPRMPDARNKVKVLPSQIIVRIDAKNHILLGANEITVQDAPAAFKALQDQTGHKFSSVIIKGDPKAYMGTVELVMSAAEGAGLINFGLANHVEGTPAGSP